MTGYRGVHYLRKLVRLAFGFGLGLDEKSLHIVLYGRVEAFVVLRDRAVDVWMPLVMGDLVKLFTLDESGGGG